GVAETENEPQPSAEPAEAFAEGLPPLEEIASATIHDLRLAEQLLEASRTLSPKPAAGRRAAVRPDSKPRGDSWRHAAPRGGSPRQPTLRDAVSGRAAAVLADDAEGYPWAEGSRYTGDRLAGIEQRLGAASGRIGQIMHSASAALARVTTEPHERRKAERRR